MNRLRTSLPLVLIALLILTMLAKLSLFCVDEREQAVITRFGEVRGTAREAGLHIKMPLSAAPETTELATG